MIARISFKLFLIIFRDQTPIRVFVGFLKTTDFNGNIKAGNFDFKRKWSYMTETISRSRTPATPPRRTLVPEAQVPRRPPPEQRRSLWSFFGANNTTPTYNIPVVDEPADEQLVQDEPSSSNSHNVQGTSSVYIKKCWIGLNGHHMSSLAQQPALESGDQLLYCQFMLTAGSFNTGQTCGITSADFNSAYFLPAFDLSSSNEGFIDLFSPAARQGVYRLFCDFSGPTKENLTAVFFTEYNSLFTVDANARISKSFST